MADLHDRETPAPNRSFPTDPRPKWRVEPCTFDDLLKRAGPYADGAKAHVEWGAVTAWHMSGKANDALAAALIPGEVASLAVSLIWPAVAHQTGWPELSDRRVTLALYELPQDAQCIARRMAAEVYALWESAGRPCLNARRFKDAYRWLVACVRSGSTPPVLTSGDIPALNF